MYACLSNFGALDPTAALYDLDEARRGPRVVREIATSSGFKICLEFGDSRVQEEFGKEKKVKRMQLHKEAKGGEGKDTDKRPSKYRRCSCEWRL
jgi:hypothetical protein